MDIKTSKENTTNATEPYDSKEKHIHANKPKKNTHTKKKQRTTRHEDKRIRTHKHNENKETQIKKKINKTKRNKTHIHT